MTTEHVTRTNPLLAIDLDALEATLRAEGDREAARGEYVAAGVEAYASRGALRSDLALLYGIGLAGRPVELGLCEIRALEELELVERHAPAAPYGTADLTPAGRELVIAARIARGL